MRILQIVFALNILIYLLPTLVFADLTYLLVTPLEIVRQYGFTTDAFPGEWWRIGTALFVHSSLPHLAINLLILFRVVPSISFFYVREWRVALLYFGSGLGGFLTHYSFYAVAQISVGASGAILGLIGALIRPFWRQGKKKLAAQFLLVCGLQFGLDTLLPAIDQAAHFGGWLSGVVLSFLLFSQAGYLKAGERR